MFILENITLASCPWGPFTANGVDLLTEIYVIQAPRSIGCCCRERNTHAEGRKAWKYIGILPFCLEKYKIHSEKKGYQNGAPGVLLLQTGVHYVTNGIPATNGTLFWKGYSFLLNNHSTLFSVGYCFGAKKVENSTPLKRGTILVPLGALFFFTWQFKVGILSQKKTAPFTQGSHFRFGVGGGGLDLLFFPVCY